MPSEIHRIESWIYATLKADVGAGGLDTLVNGRIYPYVATQGAAYPLVTYSLQAGRDVEGLGVNRVMTRPIYLIKVISKGAPSTAAKSAADRIDELIGKAVSLVKDGYVFTGRRDQSISLVEVDSSSQSSGGTGAQYWHVGGLFRIECYPVG